ncbi:MAG: hypothetical protein LRZ84_06305 [Desertifilum sp.]|nr:hypothetical protein [Oscillatoria laete-virens]MCD8486352.1 hypothetical protein [Desertifilum sp.]MDI9641858.1 hypothetical protein [Geitlerinema splendidum]MDL5053551.1 hypothetical protein [Oscillatoria laete-virens NRMC-F 0139]
MLEPLHSVSSPDYPETSVLPPIGDRLFAGVRVGCAYVLNLSRAIAFLGLVAIASVPLFCLSLLTLSDEGDNR